MSAKHGGSTRGAGLVAVGLVALIGCGERFRALCQEGPTCVASAGSGGMSGDPPTSGGSGGAPREPSEGGGGSDSGGGGAPSDCSVAADCSNGDPKDGEEGCSDGVCTPGNPPPTVLLVTPKPDAMSVEPDATVVIEFSEALDGASVTAESVKLLDGDIPVLGALSYAANKITLVPSAPLALSRSYRVSVATSIKDAGGAALSEAFSSAFQVRDGRWKVTDIVQKSGVRLSQELAITARGDVLVAWLEENSSACSIFIRWFARGAASMPASVLPNRSGACYELTSAANAAGVAAVAWAEQTHGSSISAVHAWQSRGAEQQGSSELVASGSQSLRISTMVSPDGRVGVLYSGEGALPSVRTTNALGVWALSPVELQAAAGRDHVTARFDAKGNGLAIWPSTFGGVTTLQAATYAASGAWSLPVTVGAAYYDGGDASLAVAPSGEAVAVWYVGTSAQGSYFSGKSWSVPETISGSSPRFEYYMSRGVVYDGSSFIAAWDVDDGQGVHYSYTAAFDATSGWGPTVSHQKSVGDGTTLPHSTRIASDGRGTTFLVWALKDSARHHELIYRRLRDGAWGPMTKVPEASLTGGLGAPDIHLTMNANGSVAVAWANQAADGNSTSAQLATFY